MANHSRERIFDKLYVIYMSNVKKCHRCGLQSSADVNVTAICKKCGASFLLCGKCQYSWKSQKCPSCDGWISSGTWDFQVIEGAGKVTEDMTSYLGELSPKTYLQLWTAQKEQRDTQRAADGDAAHRGIALDAGEVEFLRAAEDLIREPIFTVRDDRGNYVVIKDGHVEKLRFFNADIRKNLPETISNLTALKEFRFEKLDRNKGSLQSLPESFAECTSLETVVLRRTSSSIKIPTLQSLPKLKQLSMYNSYTYYASDTKQVFALTGLEELNLGNCVLSNSILEENLGNMINLRKLNLRSTKEWDALPESMVQLQQLEELDLVFTKIGERFNSWPEWLMKIPTLKKVYRGYFQSKDWELIEPALRERNPEMYPDLQLDPAETKQMDANEERAWWEKNYSQIWKDCWTGIE
jgi:hypothetical protein